MPFERPSIETIKDRIEKGIEARLFGKLALLRNAVLRILARVFAGAIHGNYGYIEYIIKYILFPTSAEGIYLDNPHGAMWGITRNPGSYASGTVIFTGTNGIIIPIDTRLQNEDGIEYGTTIPVTISGGIASATVQAIESGETGNFIRTNPPDPIYLQMVSPIAGVDDEIEVDGDITGGADAESDDEYRDRILQRIQSTPAGGSASDYVTWALSYSGVNRAWCYPLANGPGTVTVVITAEGDDPVPSSLLLTDVQGYIDDLRPVTADLTVASITNYSDAPGKALFNMTLRITPAGSDYQSAIEENIRSLLLPYKPGTTIPISQIRAAISNAGINDYRIDAMSLDGTPISVDDIALTGYQYAWLNSITFSELI